MADIVLVHGAWGDAGIWQAVSTELRDQGHRMLAAELPLTSLADDIDHTRREISAIGGPVTLVGHSYAGAVISGAAEPGTQVETLVFVAAYAPDAGETTAALNRDNTAVGRTAIRFSSDGWSSIDHDLFAAALAADVPPTTAQVLATTQKSTHSSCFTTPAGRGAWHDITCAYLISSEDRILDPASQRWFANRTNAATTELRSSHLSPVSHPHEVATAIIAAQASAAAHTPT